MNRPWITNVQLVFINSGTVQEIKEEKERKQKEMTLFKELGEYKKTKDKETFLQVGGRGLGFSDLIKMGKLSFILLTTLFNEMLNELEILFYFSVLWVRCDDDCHRHHRLCFIFSCEV